jgi:bifunctional enzyme CysN/CysC/sulfate adenylyltransferase subunit 1
MDAAPHLDQNVRHKEAIFEDLDSVEATSQSRGYDYTDLALLTDGLRSERASRASRSTWPTATSRRQSASSSSRTPPGHIQYTRNMVTGASAADLGLVLVDARQGLTEQSRRHAVILWLLRVPHLVLAVNKMDLVDYDEAVYDMIQADFTSFATKLNIPDLEIIPISALKGDNLVNRFENMPWYDGQSLMHHLEDVHVASDRDLVDTRFPVQYVVRPKSEEFHDYCGYAGRVAGGVLKPGDDILVLPSGMTSKTEGIDMFDQEIDEAFPPMSVTARLEDFDVSRGDMDLPATERTQAQPGHRRDDLLDDQRAAASAPEARYQPHHPDGPRLGQGHPVLPRREHPAPGQGDQGAGDQRDRSRAAAPLSAALRPLQQEPPAPSSSSTRPPA